MVDAARSRSAAWLRRVVHPRAWPVRWRIAAVSSGLTLAILPALSILGFGLLALAPSIAAIVGFQVLRRAGNFAISRPIREVLFTVVALLVGNALLRPRSGARGEKP